MSNELKDFNWSSKDIWKRSAKNINGFNFTVGSNYTLMSEIPDYGANLEVSSKF